MGRIIKLKNYELDLIKQSIGEHYYRSEAPFVYEGQIPNIGIVVVDGEVRPQKAPRSIGPGHAIGIWEMMNHESFSQTITIGPQSSICLIPKSIIYDAMESNQNQELRNVLQRLFTSGR